MNPTGTFSEKAKTSLSQSNNSLTVPETLIITDAVEVFLPMPSNTLDMSEVLKLMLPIPTLPRTELAFSENQLLLDTSDTEASTSLKEMRSNSQKDSTTLDQLQFHSKLSQASRTTTAESMLSTTVVLVLKRSTTLFWLLAMDKKMERSSGISRTHGELLGEPVDTSKWREELTCAPLLSATLTLSSMSVNSLVLSLLPDSHRLKPSNY